MNQPIPDLTQPPPVAVPGLDVLAPAPSGLAGQVANVFEGAVGLTMAGARFANMMRERDQQEFEAQQRYNAQTEAQFRAIESEFTKTIEGKADAQARLDIPILLGKLDRGEIVPPSNMSREEQIKWANDITDSQTSGQSDIFKERYKQMVSDNLVTGLQTKANAIAAQDKADIVYSLQNRAITATADDLARIKVEAAAIDVKGAEFDSKIVVPIIQQAASTGDAGRLDEIKAFVPDAMMDLWNNAKKQAVATEEANTRQNVAGTLGLFNQRLSTLQTASLQGKPDIGAMYSLLNDVDKYTASVKPEFADNSNAVAGTVRTMISATQREAIENARKINVQAVKDTVIQQALALSEVGGLSSGLGDRPFEAEVAGEKISMSPTDIKSRVRDIKFSQIQERIYADPNIPDADKPRAYGLEIARWAGKNGLTLDNVKTQMGESFSLLQEAMAEGNPNRDQLLSRVATSFETFKGTQAANNNALGSDNENTVFFEAAKLVQDNASVMFGKPLSNTEVLQMVYKNAGGSVPAEKIDAAAKDVASRWGMFNDIKNAGEMGVQIKKNVSALMVLGSGLSQDKLLEKAKEMTDRQGQVINGYWTRLDMKLKSDFEGTPMKSANFNDEFQRIANKVAASLKDNPEYTFDGKPLSGSDIALYQDPKTGGVFLIDTRVGNGRRIVSEELGLPASFRPESLVKLVNQNILNREVANAKSARDQAEELKRNPISFVDAYKTGRAP